MNAAIFNYLESILWFILALILFLKINIVHEHLRNITRLAIGTFIIFGISDVLEASTGAWWHPWWLLLMKAACIVSFLYCYIQYLHYKKIKEHDV